MIAETSDEATTLALAKAQAMALYAQPVTVRAATGEPAARLLSLPAASSMLHIAGHGAGDAADSARNSISGQIQLAPNGGALAICTRARHTSGPGVPRPSARR